MSYILALDQGTTSSRALVFDHAGNVRGSAQKEFRQIYPNAGWIEHDPREILASQTGVAAEALIHAGLSARDVAAIGITNQRETTVVWDRATGAPVYNAIVWQDRRTAAHCDQLKAAGSEPLFTRKTGLVLDAYFSGTKLHWILANVPGAREKARAGRLAFGTIDTWLIWHLSGGRSHTTDASNASRTLLYNLHEGCWDEELLDILDIPRSLLPEVGPSSGAIAETAGDLFAAHIPITGVAGDQQAALFGQCCFTPGMVKNTYGTGCFMLMHTGSQAKVSRNRLLTTAAWTRGRAATFALEGSVFVGGAVVQWLRDGLGLFRSSAEVEPLAASVPDSDGVYFVPAFTGLGAPHWDPYARGTLLGLTRGTTRAHVARAALEGIAYQVADVLTAMQADAAIPVTELRVDGGAAANNLLMQFQADLLGVPVVRPRQLESTAQGAAYLAGLAVGYWQDEAEIRALWKVDRVFEPSIDEGLRGELLASWQRALGRAKGWVER
ncbi:MAG: glycerol kinase GlpK [Betaproteobacteria bacterium]|nr:glycerol kinase GlpK [Betaproteobacteria bacterium]